MGDWEGVWGWFLGLDYSALDVAFYETVFLGKLDLFAVRLFWLLFRVVRFCYFLMDCWFANCWHLVLAWLSYFTLHGYLNQIIYILIINQPTPILRHFLLLISHKLHTKLLQRPNRRHNPRLRHSFCFLLQNKIIFIQRHKISSISFLRRWYWTLYMYFNSCLFLLLFIDFEIIIITILLLVLLSFWLVFALGFIDAVETFA